MVQYGTMVSANFRCEASTFAQKGVVLGGFFGNFRRSPQELRIQISGRITNRNPILRFQFVECYGVTVDVCREGLHDGRLRRAFDDGLELRRKRVPEVLVDDDFAKIRRLVNALQVIVLPDLLQAELDVLAGVDSLGRVDDTLLGGRHDLAAR